MEPVDERITAAHLMAMRLDAGATDAIARLLSINQMPPNLAARTKREIGEFVVSGDATLASQLIHAAMVRGRGKRGATSAGAGSEGTRGR